MIRVPRGHPAHPAIKASPEIPEARLVPRGHPGHPARKGIPAPTVRRGRRAFRAILGLRVQKDRREKLDLLAFRDPRVTPAQRE